MKPAQTIFISRVTSEFGPLVTRISQSCDQIRGTIDLNYQDLDRRGAQYADARSTLAKLMDWISQAQAIFVLSGQKQGYQAAGGWNTSLMEGLKELIDAAQFECVRRDIEVLQERGLELSYTQLELLIAKALRKDVLIFLIGKAESCEPGQRLFREWLQEEAIEGWDRVSVDFEDREAVDRIVHAEILNRLLSRSLAISSSLILSSPVDASFEMRLSWLSGGISSDFVSTEAGEAYRQLIIQQLDKHVLWVESEELVDEEPAGSCWKAIEADKWLLTYENRPPCLSKNEQWRVKPFQSRLSLPIRPCRRGA